MSAVVSDTSPLHYLIECEAVHILPALFRELFIPPTVHRELQHERTPLLVRAWVQSLPNWIRVQASAALDPALNVDEGEREAICLARSSRSRIPVLKIRDGVALFPPIDGQFCRSE